MNEHTLYICNKSKKYGCHIGIDICIHRIPHTYDTDCNKNWCCVFKIEVKCVVLHADLIEDGEFEV